MFLKPFRVKSNSILRGSDKKRLRNEVEKQFSFDEDVSTIISNKEEISVSKVYSHKGDSIVVYCAKGNPILFELENKLYPTVYFLWDQHGIVPHVTTHNVVIKKLLSGADLMLPGILPASDDAEFKKGDVIAVNTDENYSSLAVGTAALSSEVVHSISSERKGKAVNVLHVYGDQLWMMGQKTPPPLITPPSVTCEEEVANEGEGEEVTDAIERLTIGDGAENLAPLGEVSEVGDEDEEDRVTCDDDDDDAVAEQSEADPAAEKMKMDKLLSDCFLTALKTRLKDKDLPVLASNFYRLHVIPCCPSDKHLDVKKTSYKKLNKFMKHLVDSELIGIKELTKGNDSITSVNRSHPDFRQFVPLQVTDPEDTGETPAAGTGNQFGVITQSAYEPPEVSVLYAITAAVKGFFQQMGCSKSSNLTQQEIRRLLTSYVARNELKSGNMVQLDPVLHDAVCNKHENDVTHLSWKDVFERLISKMKQNHQLKFPGLEEGIVVKGPVPTIHISLQQRASNKKVTLVKNLESFCIDPQSFSDVIRKQAQASTSVAELPSSKPNHVAHQVMIQGNQVAIIERILTGPMYRLPRKYLQGLENAATKKSKR